MQQQSRPLLTSSHTPPSRLVQTFLALVWGTVQNAQAGLWLPEPSRRLSSPTVPGAALWPACPGSPSAASTAEARARAQPVRRLPQGWESQRLRSPTVETRKGRLAGNPKCLCTCPDRTSAYLGSCPSPSSVHTPVTLPAEQTPDTA